jgi:hypothetical protein
MEAIIQQYGDEMAQEFTNDMTPEEWIDESIKGYFWDCSVIWWEELNLEIDDYRQEMKDYLQNKESREIRLDLSFSALSQEDGQMIYNYGYYKGKEYRDIWVDSIKNNSIE